jgi:tetratricopeptide (TPR) repeat protein
VRVAPDELQAWNNLANTYMELGRFDDARRALETGLKLQDSAGVRTNLFVIGVLTNDQALADAQLAAMQGRRDEVDLLSVRIAAAAYRGRMKEAASALEVWTSKMDAASRRANTGEGIANLAIYEVMVGQTDAAGQRLEAALEDERLGDGQLVERLVVAAIAGDAATARQLLTPAIAEQRQANSFADVAERAMRALAEVAEGRPAEAIPLLEPITLEGRNFDLITMWTLANIRAARWDTAVKGLAFIAAERSQRAFGAMKPWGMAMLGRAYAELGRKEEARKAYQAFFDLWKDADPDVPLLVNARAEFAQLGS